MLDIHCTALFCIGACRHHASSCRQALHCWPLPALACMDQTASCTSEAHLCRLPLNWRLCRQFIPVLMLHAAPAAACPAATVTSAARPCGIGPCSMHPKGTQHEPASLLHVPH